MPSELVLTLIHGGLAIQFIVLGYLIKAKEWSFLIAGYNTSSAEERAKYDTPALCHGVSRLMYFLGFAVSVPAVGLPFGASWTMGLGWGLFVVAAVTFLVYANTGGRYRMRC